MRGIVCLLCSSSIVLRGEISLHVHRKQERSFQPKWVSFLFRSQALKARILIVDRTSSAPEAPLTACPSFNINICVQINKMLSNATLAQLEEHTAEVSCVESPGSCRYCQDSKPETRDSGTVGSLVQIRHVANF